MAGRNIGTTVTSESATDKDAEPARSTLHIVYPPELRRAFPLGEKETVIGRDPGLDGLLLDHGTISRQHAALAWSAAHRAHAARDLGSRNGTRVDGVSAAGDARPLVSGSLLRLGDTLLVYEQAAPGDDADGAAVSRDDVPGEAAGIRRLRAALARAAADPAPILVRGETGTGKERIAREIHRLSGRGGKLVAVNCAALSAEIVESQLFGHVKGAFTGASEAQPGLYRAANGGTLFLDEIGDLPLPLQPKLLRVLQEGELLPVGATQPVRVDVRVVAATHRDLVRAVADRQFREDLYARLSVWELQVPPLRERRVDLLDWIDRLYKHWTSIRQGTLSGSPIPPATDSAGQSPASSTRLRDAAGTLRFDVDAAEALLRFAWPLNLRGVERLVHELGAGGRAAGVIGKAALPPWLAAGAAPAAAPAAASPAPAAAASERDPVPTREEFTRAFEELSGSVHGLARRFGRDRRQIYRWLEAYGLGDKRGRK